MSDYSRIETQIALSDDQLKHKKHKGISFVRQIGNKIEFINIPSTSEQLFKYFYNPSKLTSDQRRKIAEDRRIKAQFIRGNSIRAITESKDES